VQECFAVLEKIEEINQKLERTGQFDQLDHEPDSAPVRMTPKN
jgi:hypothetical protein